MTKQEFLKLFELEDVYLKYQNNIPFSLGYHDVLTNTQNKIHFSFISQKNIRVILYTTEFNKETQKLELNLILSDNLITFDEKEQFINEIFPFLTFDTNFEAALKFVANFINKILIPKYELKGNILLY